MGGVQSMGLRKNQTWLSTHTLTCEAEKLPRTFWSGFIQVIDRKGCSSWDQCRLWSIVSGSHPPTPAQAIWKKTKQNAEQFWKTKKKSCWHAHALIFPTYWSKNPMMLCILQTQRSWTDCTLQAPAAETAPEFYLLTGKLFSPHMFWWWQALFHLAVPPPQENRNVRNNFWFDTCRSAHVPLQFKNCLHTC